MNLVFDIGGSQGSATLPFFLQQNGCLIFLCDFSTPSLFGYTSIEHLALFINSLFLHNEYSLEIQTMSTSALLV